MAYFLNRNCPKRANPDQLIILSPILRHIRADSLTANLCYVYRHRILCVFSCTCSPPTRTYKVDSVKKSTRFWRRSGLTLIPSAGWTIWMPSSRRHWGRRSRWRRPDEGQRVFKLCCLWTVKDVIPWAHWPQWDANQEAESTSPRQSPPRPFSWKSNCQNKETTCAERCFGLKPRIGSFLTVLKYIPLLTEKFLVNLLFCTENISTAES